MRTDPTARMHHSRKQEGQQNPWRRQVSMQGTPGPDHGPEPSRGQRNDHAPHGKTAGQHPAPVAHRQGVMLMFGTRLHIKAVDRSTPDGSQFVHNALHSAVAGRPFAQELVGGVNQGLVGNAIQGWGV